jgi:hypothetical protein
VSVARDFAALRELTSHTARFRDRTGKDAYNEPSFGAWSAALPVQWEREEKVVRNEMGEEVVVSSTLYVLGVDEDTEPPEISTLSDVEMPDSTDSGPLVGVDSFYDSHGKAQVRVVRVGKRR